MKKEDYIERKNRSNSSSKNLMKSTSRRTSPIPLEQR